MYDWTATLSLPWSIVSSFAPAPEPPPSSEPHEVSPASPMQRTADTACIRRMPSTCAPPRLGLIYQPYNQRYIVMSQMSSATDVVVIGGGTIGAAAAYELTRRGATVTVLERDRGPDGCSFGNAGLICPSHAEAIASLDSIRSGFAWLGRRDSPFYLRPRLPLLPWLVRFG